MCGFDYDPSRGGQVPQRLLAGFSGYLQTDGYEGYNALVRSAPGITRLGCQVAGVNYFFLRKF